MKRKFTFLIAALALLAMIAHPLKSWADPVTLVSGSGTSGYTVPTGWTTTGTVEGGSYLKIDGGTITSPEFAAHTGLSFTYTVATFGSGDNHPLTIRILNSSTNAIIKEETTATPTSSTYINTGSPISLGDIDVAFKIQFEAPTAKGIRLRNYSITGTPSGGTNPTYTVTYDANGGTGTMTDPNSPYEVNDEVTLLENTFEAPEGKMWGSWLVKDADDQTIDVVNGKFSMPASNVTVTAQWVDDPNAPQYNWVLTDLADLTSSDVFVIVGNNGNNYAMSNNNGTSSAPTAVSVSVENNKITSTVASTIQWNISGNATDGYVFYPNGSTTTWLYCTGENNGVRVGATNTNSYDKFSIKDNYIYNIGRSAYLGVFNSQDWRRYTSINSNISGQTFAFYKKVAAGTVPPSITANNVDILFNAENGNINYTINDAPNPAGTLTAAVKEGTTPTIANFDLGTVTNSAVLFTCSANTESTTRTAIVTLTYTYNETETVTTDVTITQAAAPVIYTTIPEIFAAATNIGGTESNVNVTLGNWVVSGVNGSNAFVTDNNGNGFIIYKKDHNFAVNDKLSGTVMGTPLKLYKGSAEFTNLTNTTEGLSSSNDGTITVITDKTIASLGGVNTGAVITLSNLTYDGTNLSDGNNTIKPYNTLYNSMSFSSGKTYNVTGVYQQFDDTKEILPRSADDIEEVVGTDPVINANNVNIDYDATSGAIAYTIDNPGTGITLGATCDANWVSNIVVGTSSVTFNTTANEGNTDRTATFTLTYTGAQDKTVTVTQGHYVVDYATLPFEYEGGTISDFDNLNGTSYNLNDNGSYAATNAPYRIKFTKDGDYLQVKCYERPGNVSVGVKVFNSGENSKITVQGSDSGENFKDIEELVIPGSADTYELETSSAFDANHRYVRLVFTKGVNVGVGPIAIAKYVAPQPAITVASTTINAPATQTEGTLNVTYTEIATDLGASIYWYTDNTGTTTTTEPDWIDAEINTNLNVDYLIGTNTGNARSAYFKVYGLDADLNDVYSDLITITQAAPASLPFSYTDDEVLSNGLSNLPDGLTQSGLGTYTSSTPRLKFDSANDELVLQTNAAPAAINFDIKGNGFADGTFTVQTSEDGSIYTNLAVFTDLTGNTKTITLINTNSAVRYVKWIYSDRQTGNVAMGNLHVTTSLMDIDGDLCIFTDVTVAELAIPDNQPCTIYNGGTLNATLSLSNGGDASNLIIKDGGQLKTPSAVYATVEKNITGYGEANANTNKGYYLISAPADKYLYVANDNNDVDAYHFDAFHEGEEWQNFKLATGAWHIAAGNAVLYASKNDCTLSLDGYGIVYNTPNPGANIVYNKVPATNVDKSVDVALNSGKTFEGWNLIGNPYTCTAYLADGTQDFYRMNSTGDAIVLAASNERAIDVCEGIFVHCNATGTVTFTTTDPTVTSTGNNNGMVNINVAQIVNSRDAQPSADYARIRINNGKDMTKFVFNENTSRVYIPQGNKDYAVVRSEARGEMPVNFKAAENGTYTIDVEAENLEVNYLHLIDNLTGMDVDLLATPSYTFEARKSDIASRFRLVFDANAGNNEDNEEFAFISDGNIVITNNGEATLQVIDMLGRIVSLQTVNGNASIDKMNANGVYVLRLINGNNVKTQKIVVK